MFKALKSLVSSTKCFKEPDFNDSGKPRKVRFCLKGLKYIFFANGLVNWHPLWTLWTCFWNIWYQPYFETCASFLKVISNSTPGLSLDFFRCSKVPKVQNYRAETLEAKNLVTNVSTVEADHYISSYFIFFLRILSRDETEKVWLFSKTFMICNRGKNVMSVHFFSLFMNCWDEQCSCIH